MASPNALVTTTDVGTLLARTAPAPAPPRIAESSELSSQNGLILSTITAMVADVTLLHAPQDFDLARLPAKHRPVAASAVDVADALEALEVEGLPSDAQIHLSAIVERQKRAHLGVPVSSAAVMLDVSPRTVREWIKGSILEALPESSPQKVTVSSLGEVLAAVNGIRAAGRDRKLFKVLLEELDDRRTRHELADRLQSLEKGEWTVVSSDDLDELLS